MCVCSLVCVRERERERERERVVCGFVYACVCVSTSAVLYIKSYVSYTSRKRFVHIVKLLIIVFHCYCSWCVLFVLLNWNVTNTNSSAHFYVTAE